MGYIIGIGGKARSGKNTLAEGMAEEVARLGKTVEMMGFADPIKEMLQVCFKYELPYNTFMDDSRKTDWVEVADDLSLTVRNLLQLVGTDCFRDVVHKDFWLFRGIRRALASPSDVVIFSDIRFRNELEKIQEYGIGIYVNRSDYERPNDPHPSEVELDSFRPLFDFYFSTKTGDIEGIKEFGASTIRNALR